MKQWVYISLMLLSTVFLLSCKDDELENVNVEDRMPELTLKFTEAEISRTSLNSSEPLQHVENVKLYIYQMDASTVAEGTTETAADFEQRIQNATLYATETLPWKNQSTSSGVSMSYKIQTPLEPGGEYVFLAVGTDAESEENYEFPITKDFGSAQARFKGKTLSEQELREKMAKSEFFSGYQVAKLWAPEAGSKSILAPLKKDGAGNYSYDKAGQTTVELTRAVAGVLLYMTDIPAKWNKAGESSDGYRVTKVKLRLHRMPASSVSLCGQSAGTGGSTEAGTEEGPVLIESMDLSELQFPSEGDLYQIVGQKGEVQTLDNTLLYGAYLLPVASESGKATFTLELWGKLCGKDGTIQEGAVEEELDSFECILENTASSDFAIERNHVYCIGQKPVADDTEGDAPVSLAGKEIVVDVQDWMPISNDIEFPYVDTNAKFNPDFDPGYRFNCINNEFKINIKCLSSNGWKLVIPKDCNWLYVNNNGYWQSSYEQPALEEGSENGNTLSLFMKDFAEKRSYKNVDDINNDVRSVKLELQTLDSEGNIVGNPKYLTIEQYNAIYLEIREEKLIGDDVYYCRGFSRLDVGDSFKKKNPGDGSEWIGVAESTGVGYGWGYWNTPPTSVLPSNGDNYDGKKNMFDLMHTGYWAKGIAMYEAYYMCIDIENGTMAPADIILESGLKRLPNENENFWYLPAMYEMRNFIYFYQYSDFIGKVTMDQWYWTMDPTGLYDRVYTARAQKLDSDGYDEDTMDRDNEYFSRPCINLGDYEE